tara:strand:+ start:344 stop:535 length:192 start_codon:yes stop_codon:yes gene_type:complete
MNVEGRNFFVTVSCYSVEGLDGQVIVKFQSGKEAIYDEIELTEMYDLAQAALGGDRTEWSPAT